MGRGDGAGKSDPLDGGVLVGWPYGVRDSETVRLLDCGPSH